MLHAVISLSEAAPQRALPSLSEPNMTVTWTTAHACGSGKDICTER